MSDGVNEEEDDSSFVDPMTEEAFEEDKKKLYFGKHFTVNKFKVLNLLIRVSTKFHLNRKLDVDNFISLNAKYVLDEIQKENVNLASKYYPYLKDTLKNFQNYMKENNYMLLGWHETFILEKGDEIKKKISQTMCSLLTEKIKLVDFSNHVNVFEFIKETIKEFVVEKKFFNSNNFILKNENLNNLIETCKKESELNIIQLYKDLFLYLIAFNVFENFSKQHYNLRMFYKMIDNAFNSEINNYKCQTNEETTKSYKYKRYIYRNFFITSKAREAKKCFVLNQFKTNLLSYILEEIDLNPDSNDINDEFKEFNQNYELLTRNDMVKYYNDYKNNDNFLTLYTYIKTGAFLPFFKQKKKPKKFKTKTLKTDEEDEEEVKRYTPSLDSVLYEVPGKKVTIGGNKRKSKKKMKKKTKLQTKKRNMFKEKN